MENILTIELCNHAKLNWLKWLFVQKMDLALNNITKIDMPSNPNKQPAEQKLCN